MSMYTKRFTLTNIFTAQNMIKDGNLHRHLVLAINQDIKDEKMLQWEKSTASTRRCKCFFLKFLMCVKQEMFSQLDIGTNVQCRLFGTNCY